MRIETRDIPQADTLQTALDVVDAVGGGMATFQEMARAIHMDPRQGRYYRLAAELLGFIARAGRNEYRLTNEGRRLLAARGADRQRVVVEAIAKATLFQRVLPFLEAKAENGCSRQEIERFIREVTAPPRGSTTIPRRTATVVRWLEEAGMIEVRGDRYYLRQLPSGIGVVTYRSDTEPLVPTRFQLEEYTTPAERIAVSRGSLTYLVHHAQRERALSAHQSLVDAVAERIRASNGIPRSNSYIDLAAEIGRQPYIFEMKSTTPRNAHSQIRLGISQLYEYRYVQGANEACLVLVLEHPVPANLQWIVDYVVQDRGVFLAWDGEGRALRCDPRQEGDLRFLL